MKTRKIIILVMILLIILTIFPIIMMSAYKNKNIENHNKEILEKVETIQNWAEEYIEQNNIVNNTATDLCMQYIRKDRYNSNLWNTLLGSIDSEFVDYVKSKENPPTFKNDVLFDPNTGKEIDFVHMIAPLNAYLKNGDSVMSMVSTDYAGWGGDLVTLLEEVTVYRTKNNIEDKNVLQEYSNSLLGTNNPSTFASSDALADLDAIALYKDSNNNVKEDLYNALYKYYVDTNSTYNANNRLSSAQTILGSTKENVKQKAKDILTNTDYIILDLKESLFQDSSVASKVTTNDIDVVSQSFANYVHGVSYLKLQKSEGSGIVGKSVIDVKIIESNANLNNSNIEIANNKIAKAEIYGEYLRITPLDAGETTITLYSEDKTVSSKYKLISQNVAPSITKDLDEVYELKLNEEIIFSIEAEGTNNVYTWYIKNETEEMFSKVAESDKNSYTMLPTQEINNAYIKCGVKNNGNDEVFSKTAKLLVCEHEYILKNDDIQHWEECSLCGEIKAETQENHLGATHPEGKCTICEYKYQEHTKSEIVAEYGNQTNETHTPIYACKFSGCESKYTGEPELHEGGKHGNEGKCTIEGCGYQYQIHTILTTPAEYKVTPSTHIPIYKCSYKECTVTEPGTEQNHKVEKYTDNGDGTHGEECTICKNAVINEHTYEDGKCIKCGVKESVPECEHKYERKNNEVQHWDECVDCGNKENIEVHQKINNGEDNGDGTHTWICVVCKYRITEKHNYIEERCTECGAEEPVPECKHEYKIKNNDIQHWEECINCGEKRNGTIQNHTYKYTDNFNGTHDVTCLKCDYLITQECTYEDEYCSYCDSKNPNLKPTECNHTYVIKENDTEHWQECSKCGKMKDGTIENHIYLYSDNGNETHIATCTRCRYKMIQAHNYENGKCTKCDAKQNVDEECLHDIYELKCNEVQHWKQCKKCGQIKEGTLQNHIYHNYIDNEDGTHSAECKICENKITSVHTYKNNICINCSAENPDAECEHNYKMNSNRTTHWRECTKCNQVENGSVEKHKITSYTDNKDGTHTGVCIICNHNLKSEHDYENEKCINCNAKQEKVEDKCEHIYVIQCDEDNDWAKCKKCGEVKAGSLKPHNYTKCINNGDGTHTKTCSNCGYKYQEKHKDGDCKECKKVITSDSNEKKEDTTTSNKEIPKAGITSLTIMIAVGLIPISVILFIKMKKY